MYTNTNTNQGSNIFCHNRKNLSNALGKEYYLSCLQLIFGLPIFFDWGNGMLSVLYASSCYSLSDNTCEIDIVKKKNID